MSAENQKKDAAVEMKKKITIVVFVIIALVLGWQLVGLFGSSTPKPVAHPTALNATKPGAIKPATTVAASNSVSPAGAINLPAAQQNSLLPPRQVAVTPDMNLMKLQKDYEEKFISALNDLQMLKVQRDIEETRQAISKAKLDTVIADKAIEKLVTIKPVVVSEPTYANMMGAPGAINDQGKTPPPPPVEAPTLPAATYLVLSVSQQNNKWNAVLGNGGKLYSVTVGDTLAVDGSVVEAINREGVTLLKNGVKKKIPITSAI